MKPTLRQMEYLVAIADTGTFGEAAKRTFVSQPSLSAQVKDMEDHIGARLLERGRHGALLTPIGEEMVKRARLLLRQVEEMKVLGREAEGTLAGRIRLGVLPTVGPYLLPQATQRLHRAYPELRLFVREERTTDLKDHLSSGKFDVIISTPGTSLDAIRQMAAMGGSVAVLPSLYAISEAKRDPQLIVRQIIHPLAQRQISLIWRYSSPLAAKFEKMGKVFTGVAKDIMA